MTAPVREPGAVERDLRNLALTTPPADLGLSPSAGHPNVFGVIMDTGFPESWVTLVALVDGTTSLYFGTGGGAIGAGEHESVRRETLALLSLAERYVQQLAAVDEFPLPPNGEVRFYLRTYAGARSAQAPQETLGAGAHALSPLFFAAHAVITAILEPLAKRREPQPAHDVTR